MKVLGLDIGGSGIKGAVVDTDAGDFATERHRIKTPVPATPEAVAATAAAIAEHFRWKGPIGAGFPAPLKHRPLRSIANLDKGWVGRDPAKLLSKATGQPVAVLNDADAAAVAEARFGGGKGRHGVLLFLTLGTGIGSSLIAEGVLVENTELGHLYLENGLTCERYASEAARDRAGLSMKEWGKRLHIVLREYEKLLWPEAIILGGGGAKKMDKFIDQVRIETPIEPALLRNKAGIIGAACHARDVLAGAVAP